MFKHWVLATGLSALSLVFSGCCSMATLGPAGSCGSGGCGTLSSCDSCGGGGCGTCSAMPMGLLSRVAGRATCSQGCGELYIDERINHPPVCDPCAGEGHYTGSSACDCKPLLSRIGELWGRPYCGGCECASASCGSGSCSTCDSGHATTQHYVGSPVIPNSGCASCGSGHVMPNHPIAEPILSAPSTIYSSGVPTPAGPRPVATPARLPSSNVQPLHQATPVPDDHANSNGQPRRIRPVSANVPVMRH